MTTNHSATYTRLTATLATPVRSLAAVFFAALMILAAGAYIAPASAHAVTCYGDYCSGQDPQTSGCSATARTIARTSVYGTGGAQWVNLRWSDACKTNWAQVSNASQNVRAVQEGGYAQNFSATNGTNSWSRMIYSPNKCVSAHYWGAWGLTTTPCF